MKALEIKFYGWTSPLGPPPGSAPWIRPCNCYVHRNIAIGSTAVGDTTYSSVLYIFPYFYDKGT